MPDHHTRARARAEAYGNMTHETTESRVIETGPQRLRTECHHSILGLLPILPGGAQQAAGVRSDALFARFFDTAQFFGVAMQRAVALPQLLWTRDLDPPSTDEPDCVRTSSLTATSRSSALCSDGITPSVLVYSAAGCGQRRVQLRLERVLSDDPSCNFSRGTSPGWRERFDGGCGVAPTSNGALPTEYCPPTLVSMGKPTRQSSTAYGGASARAVDGRARFF